MNEPAERRNGKILELIYDNPAGLFDYKISELLKWDIQAVRAVCGILKKRGNITVKEVERNNAVNWYILSNDKQEYDNPNLELRTATDRLGKAISDFLYVILREKS